MRENDQSHVHDDIRPADLFPGLTVTMAIVLVAFVVFYLATLSPPYDRWQGIVGRDFVNMWTGARAALSGHVERLFDNELYLAELRRAFPDATWHNWSYPPGLLLLIWPLGLMPYMAAWTLWSLGGLALYLFTAAGRARSFKNFFALTASPAAGVNLFFGQNGFFTAAMIIGAVREMDRRPVLAGVCLGLLTLKPQMGILFPLALIISGRWRCLAAATATGAALVTVTGALFGFECWTSFFKEALPYQTLVMTTYRGPFLAMMPTAFAIGRLWQEQAGLPWLFQAPFTIFAIAAVAWTFKERRDPVLSGAVLIAASFLVTPYIFVYDMVVLGWVLAVLHNRLGPDWSLAAGIWLLPLLTILSGFLVMSDMPGPPLAPFLLTALLYQLVSMLHGATACAPAAIALRAGQR